MSDKEIIELLKALRKNDTQHSTDPVYYGPVQ
jgi:hypothetical protein